MLAPPAPEEPGWLVEICGQIPFKPRDVPIWIIQRAVAEHTSVTPRQMMSMRKNHHMLDARFLAIYLSAELTTHSLNAIGRAFDRDHSTINHALKVFRKRLETDEVMRWLHARIKAELERQWTC